MSTITKIRYLLLCLVSDLQKSANIFLSTVVSTSSHLSKRDCSGMKIKKPNNISHICELERLRKLLNCKSSSYFA